MPAKSKFKAQDIIDAAFNIVRAQGAEKCSARAIAHELHSSTMPIYSCTKSMKELEEAVVRKAIDLLLHYEMQKRTGITSLDMGIGYILFAKKEKHLFRMLFFSEAGDDNAELSERLREYAFDTLMEKLTGFAPMEGLSREQKRDVFNKMWIFNHGLAVMLNNSVIEDMSEEEISRLLMDTGLYMLEGIKNRDELYAQENIMAFLDSTGRNKIP